MEKPRTVTIHRWAKRPSHVYVEYTDDGSVCAIHIGRPPFLHRTNDRTLQVGESETIKLEGDNG